MINFLLMTIYSVKQNVLHAYRICLHKHEIATQAVVHPIDCRLITYDSLIDLCRYKRLVTRAQFKVSASCLWFELGSTLTGPSL